MFASSPYGWLERWLHRFALGFAPVRQVSFDIEKATALPRNVADPGARAVYVCGLARSGTTTLLRTLEKTGAFRSLVYRDMPFVLAPNLWWRLSRFATRSAEVQERAHGDGILVGFDSPEAFEEVFWRTFCAGSGDPACVGTEPPSAEVMREFALYRELVTRPRGAAADATPRRYLSKNNSNLLRLPSLAAEADATVLLVFRDPVETARSLFRQHRQFCERQSGDAFTRDYMGWLGHYEFGLDHRPFCFARPRMDPALQPRVVDYWLDYWDAVYRHVLDQAGPRLHLIDHDALCERPVESLGAILDLIGVRADAVALAADIHGKAAPPATEFSAPLLERARETHARLRASPSNLLMRERGTS